MINAVLEAIEGLRVALGPGLIFLYIAQGLFHPARRVREVYWKIYNNCLLGAQEAMAVHYPANIYEDGCDGCWEQEVFI